VGGVKFLFWLVDTRAGQRALIATLVLLLGGATFAWSLRVAQAPGLPIDDAWIFQTFARNLARSGEVAFNPGVPATGASSWLWLLLLVPGYWLPLAPLGWTYALNLLAAMALGWTMLELGARFIPSQAAQRWALLAAVLTICEWHLVWSLLGGMETLLFTFLSLLLVTFYVDARPAWWQGLVGGLLIATRIEGILLFGLVWLWNFRKRRWRERVILGLAALVVIAPMLWTNWSVGGMLLPNTWAAKGLTIQQPSAGISFLFEYAMLLLLGVNVLLIPAVLFALQAPRAQKRIWALPMTWVLLLLATYVFAFPIVYHHMRYMMPTLPWWVLVGVAGTARLFRTNRAAGWLQVGLTGAFAAGLVLFGANVYAWNVQNVNGQHVAVGRWFNAHTPADTVVAAEDIGAIGYFSQRTVIDIQGLVTPQVVPLLRAQQSLTPFLCSQSVKFLAVYPRVLPRFADGFDATPVFQAHLELNTINPDVNLNVYPAKTCAP